jgi:GH24 family phage-related lysozyme (muramidase)
MSAISPTKNTGLIIDEFIRYATNHLNTIIGQANMISTFPPAGTPSPTGVLFWNGYFITPATPSVPEAPTAPTDTVDPNSTNQPEIKISEIDDSDRKKTFAELYPEEAAQYEESGLVFDEETRKVEPLAEKKVAGRSAKAVTVNIGNIDFTGEWQDAAAKFIAKYEGFINTADNDEGTLRLGFGSDRIYDPSTKTIRKVKAGDTTTQENALKVLAYEVSVTYKNRLVGNGKKKITQEQFDSLKTPQKVALLDFVYNCGSLNTKGGNEILAGINAKDYTKAAAGIANGPISGASSGKIYDGLVRRRAEESAVFLK